MSGLIKEELCCHFSYCYDLSAILSDPNINLELYGKKVYLQFIFFIIISGIFHHANLYVSGTYLQIVVFLYSEFPLMT